MSWRIATVLGLIFVSIAGQAIAEDRENIAAGHQLVQKFCGRCHAIGLTGTSRHPDAPPFRRIVARGHVENLSAWRGDYRWPSRHAAIQI